MVKKLSMQFLYPNGATPLDPDEAAGFIISWSGSILFQMETVGMRE
jgi:hypothetical protein